jgi:hypothetical protein
LGYGVVEGRCECSPRRLVVTLHTGERACFDPKDLRGPCDQDPLTAARKEGM